MAPRDFQTFKKLLVGELSRSGIRADTFAAVLTRLQEQVFRAELARSVGKSIISRGFI